jgi:HD-like signal output (HDOD) protein
MPEPSDQAAAGRRPARLDESAVVPVATSKQRVLFVDDEPAILDGLRSALRSQRREWDMLFAVGGQAGLDELKRCSFDVVVTDMRMPVVDGAELLRQAKQLQAHAVRIVLSGQTDAESAMRTVFTAHQFLAKPCDVESLRSVVKRACDLHRLVSGEALRSLAGDVSLLPAAPRTYLAISQALSNSACNINDVARIVERDPALCAKLLQVANSAFFGLPRAVNSVTQAANYLGTIALRNLALAMETLASVSQIKPALSAANFADFQLNSLLTGLLGRHWFGGDRRKADDAFVAGMLRDMGHFVLLAQKPEHAAGAAGHAPLSAYLLGLWGLPHSVLEPVAFHELPEQVEHDTLDVVDVVHLADRVAAELVPSPFQPQPGPLSISHLERLGVTPETIDQLREAAGRLLPQTREMLGR